MRIFSRLLNLSTFKMIAMWLVFFGLVPAAFAQPINNLRAYVWEQSVGWTIDETLTSNTGPVSYDSTPGVSPPVPTLGFGNSGEVAGYADFGLLRAQALSSSRNYVNRNAYADVETSYQVTVVGGPGFSLGDVVSLNLSFRLDGALNSGAASGDTTGSAGVDADLTVIDPNIKLDCGSPDGCYTPKLLDFWADVSSNSSGTSGETYNAWNWNLKTRNAENTVIDLQSDSDSWIVGPGASCLPAPINNYCVNDINFDSGILSTVIETTVGATLDVNASLNILSQSWDYAGDGAYGSADFFDTFGIVLTPITDGVELSYGGITPASFFSETDTNEDGVIGDFELLNAIDDWADAILGDFALLDLIDIWAAGCYYWDALNNQYKSGCRVFVQTKSETDLDYNGSIDSATYNTYDANGNLTKREDDSNNNGSIDRVFYYTYDANGNKIKQERDNDGNGSIDSVTYYTNDANGNLTAAMSDNDGNGSIDSVTYYTNDTNGNLTAAMSDNDGNGSIDSATYYTNDINGNPIILRRDTNFDNVIDSASYYTYYANGNTAKYEYDNTYNGDIDSVTYYTNNANGNNIKREYDTNNDTVIDYVAYFTWTEL